MEIVIRNFALIIAAYLIGSIPSGYIAGRLWKGIDIRKSGDGNVGAANVFRQIGAAAGLCVMGADIAKGALAIILVQAFAGQAMVLLAGLAVLAGHTWPLFLGFKGGRGEATVTGVLLVLFPQAMLILMAVALVPFIMTRNTMLLGAMLFAPLWLIEIYVGAGWLLVGYCIALPVLVGLNHYLTTRHQSSETKKFGRLMRQ